MLSEVKSRFCGRVVEWWRKRRYAIEPINLVKITLKKMLILIAKPKGDCNNNQHYLFLKSGFFIYLKASQDIST
jgi:hypothetical protein